MLMHRSITGLELIHSFPDSKLHSNRIFIGFLVSLMFFGANKAFFLIADHFRGFVILEKFKQNLFLVFFQNMSKIDDTAPKRGKFEQNREIFKIPRF